MQVPLTVVLPAALTRAAVRQIATGSWQPPAARPGSFATDIGKLLAVRLNTLIVAMALLEGAAFFACIAYLLEGQAVALVAVGVALALMLVRFPTEARVRAWLEQQAERLAQLRQGQ